MLHKSDTQHQVSSHKTKQVPGKLLSSRSATLNGLHRAEWPIMVRAPIKRYRLKTCYPACSTYPGRVASRPCQIQPPIARTQSAFFISVAKKKEHEALLSMIDIYRYEIVQTFPKFLSYPNVNANASTPLPSNLISSKCSEYSPF